MEKQTAVLCALRQPLYITYTIKIKQGMLMQFGKVIGNIVSTRKTPCGIGLPLLVVQLLNDELQPVDKAVACTDSINARIGDIVLTCGSSSARMTERTRNVCTDNAIIAVVETVSHGKTDVYRKDSNSE